MEQLPAAEEEEAITDCLGERLFPLDPVQDCFHKNESFGALMFKA